MAPGETERTCRKIGAHVKEQAKHDKMANTPEGKEYLRTYRRLQARRKYGTISTDEWNAQVAEAQSILDSARNGELTEQEMRAAFNAIGGEKRKWARKSGSGSQLIRSRSVFCFLCGFKIPSTFSLSAPTVRRIAA